MNNNQKQIDIIESYNKYKSTIRRLSLDIPISALCLPKKIEKKLIRANLHRVVDLADSNFLRNIDFSISERHHVETQVAIFSHELL